MDFKSVNPLNVRINTVSFNFLPLTSGDSRFSWKIYRVFGWILELIITIVIILGCMHVSTQKFLKDGMICVVLLIEVPFVIIQIHSRDHLVRQLIRKLNDILRVDNKIMKNVVTTTLKPVMIALNFYWSAGVASIVVWYCMSFALVFKKNIFYYEDYRQPAAFSRQPFSFRIFLLGSLFLLISCLYVFTKKAGVDIYMMHLILMVTAQYRYIALKVATILRDGNPQNVFDESNQKYSPGVDRWVEEEMKVLCRHHNSIIHLSFMLKKVLSVNCSMIYVNSVLRFCCISIMIGSVLSSFSVECFLIITYSSGSIVQFYMLCFCVQQLLDASTKLTNKAFHEKWYEYGPSVKRTFMLMILGNNVGCKLSKSDKFTLSLPAFMTILNQSYSIALLLLKAK